MLATLLTEIAARHGLKRRGNSTRYVGPCPKCGGSKGSDKFVIKDDGGFKCYSCNFKGDIITWLREMEGQSCAEAHEHTGLPCRSVFCQVRGTCRLGDGSGKRPTKADISVNPPPPEKAASLPISDGKTPQEIWQSWAIELVGKAADRLQQQPEVIGWLASRGISAAAAVRFRLGWLHHQRKVPRVSIGLPLKEGKPDLWIPDGLVIPTFTASGEIQRLRIRRPEASREKFLPNLKYVWIEGSGTLPLTIRPDADQGRSRGVVIVEAELDAMAVAAAHEQVTAIAIGTVSAGLPPDLHLEMETMPTILVTLDADPGKDGKPGPGPAAVKKWLANFRQAKFWPVPQGKDPGDYAGAGFTLRPWIESGLIPEIDSVSKHDLACIPGSPSTGGEGEDSPTPETIPALETRPVAVHHIVTLIDGREFHITNDKSLWSRLTLEGKIAFSENELKRLQLACGAMTKAERARMALQAVDIKETFTGSYIRGGEVLA